MSDRCASSEPSPTSSLSELSSVDVTGMSTDSVSPSLSGGVDEGAVGLDESLVAPRQLDFLPLCLRDCGQLADLVAEGCHGLALLDFHLNGLT